MKIVEGTRQRRRFIMVTVYLCVVALLWVLIILMLTNVIPLNVSRNVVMTVAFVLFMVGYHLWPIKDKDDD
jgi:hypothetical protein